MKIQYVTGDGTKAAERYILHGVNAQGRMGSGFAKALMTAYPRMRQDYIDTYNAQDQKLHMGQLIWTPGIPHTCISAVTQEFAGNDGGFYVSYDAMASVFEQLDREAALRNIDAIAMPLIGAGLAGGDWKIISEIIELSANHFQPVVYLIDGKVPA
jgi:O-acetyl-ADP-ribose deacetylase (regulator of RNase III)